MRRILFVFFILVALRSSGQFKNTKLVEGGELSALETSVVLNNRNPKNIVAAVGPGRVFYSSDLGATWSESKLESSYGFYGSPSLISDMKGHILLFHGTDPGGEGEKNDWWLDRISCQKSEDGGATWSAAASIGNNPPKDQLFARPAFHLKKQVFYAAWTQFDKFHSEDPKCHSTIQFSTSTNGSKWTRPIQISQNLGSCIGDRSSVSGAVVGAGLDDRVYVIWALQDLLLLDRSYDAGETWLTNDVLAFKQTGGGNMRIPGFGAINSLPSFIIDVSPSRAPGSLYMMFADQKNGSDDTDILLVRSVSHGDNWAVPIRINRDEPGKQQFAPTLCLDPATGHLYAVFYDRRSYDDNQTDVYLAYSFDGGNVFREVKVSESPFVPNVETFTGNRVAVSARAGIISLMWTRLDGTKPSIWTVTTSDDELKKIK